jgi:hypothetical protein
MTCGRGNGGARGGGEVLVHAAPRSARRPRARDACPQRARFSRTRMFTTIGVPSKP